MRPGARPPWTARAADLVACILVAATIGWASAQEAPGGVRFVHLAADAPLVDVLVDGRAVFRDVGFGDVTEYVPVSTGRRAIEVVPHRLRRADMGGDDGASEGTRARALESVTTRLTVADGVYHTAVLAGFYEPPAEDGELGSLSIALTPDDASISVSGPRGYSDAFEGDQLLTGIQPGTYTIEADRDGYSAATYEADVRPRQTTTVSITLQEGDDDPEPSERMVEPAGDADTWAALQVQTFSDDFGGVPAAGTAMVRIVHASPTSPALHVVAEPDAEDSGDPVELGSVSYPAAGSFAAVPAGRFTLRFEVQGSQRTLVEVLGLELVGGTVYTFFLASEPTGSRARIVPTVDAAIVWDGVAP